jgi:hypothetical protein
MTTPAERKRSVRAVAQFQSNTAINAILAGTYVGVSAPKMVTQGAERAARKSGQGEDKYWTLKRARLAVEQMRASRITPGSEAPQTLFRGTLLPWPTTVFTGNGNGAAPKSLALDPAVTDADMLHMARCGAPVKVTHPLSCTSDSRIAREFADAAARRSRRRGWVHSFSAGLELCDVVGVNETLAGAGGPSAIASLAQREKEYVLLPPAPADAPGAPCLWMHLVSACERDRRAVWRIVRA